MAGWQLCDGGLGLLSIPAYHITTRGQWYLSLEPPMQALEFVITNSQPPLSRYLLYALVS